MNAALSPLQRARGALVLRFRADAAGTTRLADLYQSDPCRALLPAPDPGEAPTAVLITTAGGLTGGDRLDFRIALEPGAAALCTPQAAEKIYRAEAGGGDADIEIALTVAAGAALEWLPQETILFDGARLRRRIRIDLAGDARLLAGDIVVFGRIARGERFAGGLLFDRWQVDLDGRPLWRDATRLDHDPAAQFAAPAGFAGAVAQGLILCRAPDPAALRDRLREAIAAAGFQAAGATLLDGLVLVRLLDDDPARLRRQFGALWCLARPALGRPAAMPRHWQF